MISCILVRLAQVIQIFQAVRVVSLSRVEHFFVSGANPQVNADSLNYEIPMAHYETPVMVVTFGNVCGKKDLISPEKSLN
jgi:hypothetical protein